MGDEEDGHVVRFPEFQDEQLHSLPGSGIEGAERFVHDTFRGHPAMIGLFVHSEPLTTFIYQRGYFTHAETLKTAACQRWLSLGICRRKLSQLAVCYTRGDEAPWRRLYTPGTHDLLSLPSYPFDRKSYWIAPSATDGAGAILCGMPEKEEDHPARELVDPPARKSAAPPARLRPKALPIPARGLLAAYLRDRIAALIRIDVADMMTDAPPRELGIDSVSAAQLKYGLERELSVDEV